MKHLVSASIFAVVSSVTAASAADFSYLSNLTLTVSGSTGLGVVTDFDQFSDSDAGGNASATADAAVTPADPSLFASGSGSAVGPVLSSATADSEASFFLEWTNSSDDTVSLNLVLGYDLSATASGLAGESALAFAGFDLFVNGDALLRETAEVDLFGAGALSDMLSGSFTFTVLVPGFDGFAELELYAFGGGFADSDVAPIPLPAGGALLFAALAGMAALRRRAAR